MMYLISKMNILVGKRFEDRAQNTHKNDHAFFLNVGHGCCPMFVHLIQNRELIYCFTQFKIIHPDQVWKYVKICSNATFQINISSHYQIWEAESYNIHPHFSPCRLSLASSEWAWWPVKWSLALFHRQQITLPSVQTEPTLLIWLAYSICYHAGEGFCAISCKLANKIKEESTPPHPHPPTQIAVSADVTTVGRIPKRFQETISRGNFQFCGSPLFILNINLFASRMGLSALDKFLDRSGKPL